MVAAFSVAPAQERPRVRLNVSDAIDFALGNHPSLRSRSAIEEGTAARVSEARSAYFPRLDVSGQENRATGNVVSGSLFSMPGIPQVMGPPTGRQFDSGVWGSAAGFGTSFNIAGLAREMALVDAAMAERERTRAGTEVQRLAVGFAAADDFITAVAASETVKAHEANVTRAEVLARIVHAEVANQLRPGAEESRANAEHALAATGLIRAEQALALSRAELAQALGIAGEPVELIAEPLLTLPSNAPSVDGVPPNHPLLAQADSETAAARARKRAATLEYLPRVDLAAALWVRGSGLFPGGLNLGDEQGLVPDTPNWAGGIVLSWPLMDIFAIRARARDRRPHAFPRSTQSKPRTISHHGYRERCTSPTVHRAGGGLGARSLGLPCPPGRSHRHLPEPRSARALRCAAIRWVVAEPDGGAGRHLLRVPLPLRQRRRAHRLAVDPGHGDVEALLPSRDGHRAINGAGGRDVVSRHRVHAARNLAPVHRALRCRLHSRRAARVLQRSAE